MTGERGTIEVMLATAPDSAREARTAVRAFVPSGRGELADRAAVVVSELVTNAVRYASGTIRLTLDWERDDLRIEVHDTSPAPPTVSQIGAMTPQGDGGLPIHGRGLPIIEALADEWGFEIAPGGKVVWARLSSRARAS